MGESTYSKFATYQRPIVVSRKSMCVICAAFALNTTFTWKKNWQENYGYLDLCIWQLFSQKWSKWISHFKENNRWYLLQWLNFEQKSEFWKLFAIKSLTSLTS